MQEDEEEAQNEFLYAQQIDDLGRTIGLTCAEPRMKSLLIAKLCRMGFFDEKLMKESRDILAKQLAFEKDEQDKRDLQGKKDEEARNNPLNKFVRLFNRRSTNPQGLSDWLQKTDIETLRIVKAEMAKHRFASLFHGEKTEATLIMEREIEKKNANTNNRGFVKSIKTAFGYPT